MPHSTRSDGLTIEICSTMSSATSMTGTPPELPSMRSPEVAKRPSSLPMTAFVATSPSADTESYSSLAYVG